MFFQAFLFASGELGSVFVSIESSQFPGKFYFLINGVKFLGR